jgi:hypothetical protein
MLQGSCHMRLVPSVVLPYGIGRRFTLLFRGRVLLLRHGPCLRHNLLGGESRGLGPSRLHRYFDFPGTAIQKKVSVNRLRAAAFGHDAYEHTAEYCGFPTLGRGTLMIFRTLKR